ncbi:MAG: sn-glycerol 3-phosphate transport system permease protein [Halanaerobiales bacterium]|nr:sn-glycerol 3-phosphate transport system permease protein [Halanaerobiales bacterium]
MIEVIKLYKYRVKKKFKIIIIHCILSFMVLLIAFPLIFALIKSTQTISEVFSYPPRLSFGSAGLNNYKTAWFDFNLGQFMFNSSLIALIITVGKIILSIMAGFAFVFFDFRCKRFLFLFILVTLMLPIPVRIVPLFDLMKQLKWGDTFYALTIPFLASATGTFLFRQHFMSFPTSIVDAAKVDGAGPIRFLIQILLPMSMNTIGALAVIEVVYVWNQYLWPLIIISSNNKNVIQVGLNSLIGTGDQGTNWGMVMAGAIIALLPPLIIFIILQEQLMRGFSLSNDK